MSIVRRELGRVATRLRDRPAAAEAGAVLGIPGLYRSPACWGGDAVRPAELESGPEWAGRCQAASFEVAVALGAPALPFVTENAFGPFELLHGVALRALFRIEEETEAVAPEMIEAALERLPELDPEDRSTALDGLAGRFSRSRARIADGLSRLVGKARSARERLRALDPLSRLDPERARRFLPELRRVLVRDIDDEVLEAALIVRTLEPRDGQARDVLRYLADHHPNPEVRLGLELRLRPPRPVPGGRA